MSNPGSPIASQAGSFQHTRSPSIASSVSEHQISYKKPVKIKNELNEKRRKALKEYYKLKKQEKELQQSQNIVERKNSRQDVDSDTELSEDQPVKEIDLLNSDFKDLVKDTNRLTSSINLINSSIKNIIYNNYYELIKLNDFLKDLNELDLSTLIVQEQKEKTTKNDALTLLNDTLDQTNTSVKSLKFEDYQGDGFTKLKSLMTEIEELDKKEVKHYNESPSDKVASNITSYLQIDNKEGIEDVKDEIKSNVERLIAQLKNSEGKKETLLQQLGEIQKKLA